MADQLPEQPEDGLISHVYPSLAGGELTALGGSPAVKVLRHSDVTTTTTGVTLTPDIAPDGGAAITGLNRLVIDQNADAFYTAATRFTAYYSAGTLAGVSLVGHTILEWSTNPTNGVLDALGDATYGLAAIETLVDDLESRLSAARAGYLDNLNVGGVVASSAEVTALNDLSAAEVNAEVVDALATDATGEPAQGAPPVSASIVTKLAWLYKALINKSTATTTQYSLYNAAGDIVDAKATLSDSAGTSTKDELVSGP